MATLGSSLTRVDPENADLLALWSSSAGDWRGTPVSSLVAFIRALTDDKVTQYFAPSSSPASVTVADGNTWLLMTPSGTIGSTTITYPTSKADKDEIIVTSSQILSAITHTGNGATISNGAPTSLSAGASFTMRYDAVLNTWFRVA